MTNSTIIKPILKLAIPLILIQLCQASLGIVDAMVAGQYNYKDLAAVGLGSAIWTPVFLFFTGVLYVFVPKFAALNNTVDTNNADANNIYHGNTHIAAQKLFLHAKNVAFWLSIIGFVIIELLAFSVTWFIQDDEVSLITRNYLMFVGLGMPGIIHMLMYRITGEGNSTLKPIVLVSFLLVIMNACLNVIFIHGFLGFPEMGGMGCGLATAVSGYIACMFLKKQITQQLPWVASAGHSVSGNNVSVDKQDSKRLLIEGLPIGFSFLLEVMALTVLAFLISTYSIRHIAAHQIVLNITLIAFMIPVAIANATTIRIAYFNGIADASNAAKVAIFTLLVTVVYATIMAALLVVYDDKIVGYFTNDDGVKEIATILMTYGAAFQFFSAMQMLISGVLRGFEDFVKPLLVILINYWLFIVPIVILSIKFNWIMRLCVEDIWLLMVVGLAVSSFVLAIVCRRKFKHIQLGS